jgi:hypothetical protein
MSGDVDARTGAAVIAMIDDQQTDFAVAGEILVIIEALPLVVVSSASFAPYRDNEGRPP